MLVSVRDSKCVTDSMHRTDSMRIVRTFPTQFFMYLGDCSLSSTYEQPTDTPSPMQFGGRKKFVSNSDSPKAKSQYGKSPGGKKGPIPMTPVFNSYGVTPTGR